MQRYTEVAGRVTALVIGSCAIEMTLNRFASWFQELSWRIFFVSLSFCEAVPRANVGNLPLLCARAAAESKTWAGTSLAN